MKKSLIVLILSVVVVSLSGCAKWEPTCTAVASVGNQDTLVQVYGVRKVAHQTQFRAGYPFNFTWVSAANFKSNTCKKE